MVRHRGLPDIVLATELSAWHWLTELADVLKDSHAPRLGQRLRDQFHLPFGQHDFVRTHYSLRECTNAFGFYLNGDQSAAAVRWGVIRLPLTRKWIANGKPVDRLAILHVLRIKCSGTSMERSRDDE